MGRRRRRHAIWLVLVMFTSMYLGVCATAVTAAGVTAACCTEVGHGHAAISNCCGTGEPSATQDLPESLRPSGLAALAVLLPWAEPSPQRGAALRHVPFVPRNVQAVLSTFLI
jgi:hypothetical protein